MIAAAKSFGGGAKLFTHDRAPRIAGRRAGLEVLTPPDAWLLPDEPSEDRRKIARLEAELRAERDRAPALSIDFGQSRGEDVLVLPVYDIPELPAAAVSRLADAYIASHPPTTLAINASFHDRQRPGFYTQAEVNRYHADRERFGESVDAYFRNLHQRLECQTSAPLLRFSIKNSGGASATDLVVELGADGDLALLDDIYANDRFLRNFEPPLPPKPENARSRAMKSLPLNISGVSPQHLKQPHDPTEFRWFSRPGAGDKVGTYGCEDFRPGEVYHDSIRLIAESVDASGSITVKVSARDVATVSRTIRVSIEKRTIIWTDDILKGLLPDAVLNLLDTLKHH